MEKIIRSSINWRESKGDGNGEEENNLVNDSINGDFLRSIGEETKKKKIIKIYHKEDGFISFIKRSEKCFSHASE